ncbi:MAG TPA: MBL fold metallo-hydrolase [Casimicrobiaceae bacterium]|nr:MBL fold metallo-hydrolase [Casimicrobiaceae bacterium]
MARSLLTVAFMISALFSQRALAQDDALARVAKAMGATDLKTLRYTADGTGWTFGQAYKPGMPWPKIKLHSVTRTINYDTGSMRDEVVLSRAEGIGGGGYPHVGTQRNDQYVSGAYAWNQLVTAPLPGPRFIADRVHQLWITPHGVLKAAIKNKAGVRRAADGGTAIAFSEPGRFNATAYVNASNLVERVESRVPDAVLGETDVVTRYGDYRDVGGIKFPTRVQQSIGGHPVLDVTVRDVQPNVAADIQVPDLVRNATERVTADKVADGVWFIAGGSHNSVVVEMKDHLALIEAPLGDVRMIPVVTEIAKLAPGKPIRYVVNSHTHFDHAGGLRAAVGEGATVITHVQNKAYFERAFATPNRVAPDHLAKSGKKARFITVDGKRTLTDGNRTLEIHSIADSHHSDAFLMVYLPKERLLIQADSFTPGAPNTPPPKDPNPNHVNLIANLERLNLAVDRILPLHGRVVPIGDLYTAAGATPR